MKKGFTLVELMVVIAIMGLLSSIVLASLNTAKNQSNNAKRAADLLSMRTALELYYNSNNTYPVVSGWQSQCSAWGGVAANSVIPNLVTGGYMPSFPADPQMSASGNTCCYLYYSTGTSYKILDHNCPTGGPNANPNPQPSLVDPTRDGGPSCTSTGVVDGTAPWAWAVWSDGTSACW